MNKMEQEEGEEGTHMGKQPSKECHNIHGIGRDYQSPSSVRRASTCKSRPHRMSEPKQDREGVHQEDSSQLGVQT